MRVFWVGNSYTYMPESLHGIPGALSLLADASGSEVYEHKRLLRGGVGLTTLAKDFLQHMQEEEEEEERHSTPFDIVVLQDQSLTPGGGAVGAAQPGEARNACLEALRREYAPLLQGDGPRGVVLYQTWGRPALMHKQPEVLGDFEEMSHKTADGYRLYQEALIGEDVAHVEIAACGDAYILLSNDKPQGARLLPLLFEDDIGHPTPVAALLIACVFARTFARLPWRRQPGREPTRVAVATAASRFGVHPEMVDPICRAAGIDVVASL